MEQRMENYTAEDTCVWSTLFERQISFLPGKASEEFLTGIEKVGFCGNQIPSFQDVNQRLSRLTGWSLYAVPGIVDNRLFFEALERREFPATTWLRRMDQLDYLEEPDMFHDVFGHVPLLSNRDFCGFLQGLAAIALENLDLPGVIEKMARIYWYTVEFGLIADPGGLRIYGAGILSSTGETDYCLGQTPKRVVFDAGRIMSTPYSTDRFQDQYFVIESFEQLYSSLDLIAHLVRAGRSGVSRSVLAG